MKKLIICAAALAMSFMANAAVANWAATATSTTLIDGSAANSVKALIFEGTLTSQTLASIADRTWDDTGYFATTITQSTGKIQAGVGDFANETVTFSMILFDGADYASATHFKYAESAPITFVTANKTVNFSTALSSAQWAEIAPEPTSGLLMLLGMGALALRRRRA